MSQQWLFNDHDQAKREFYKKEQILPEGILVLIDQAVYLFENKKAWESQQAELLKTSPSQHFIITYYPENDG